MKSKILCLVALLASLTGCFPVDSLNSLYTYNNDVIFDESLIGYWVGPDNGKHVGVQFSKFEEGRKKGYTVNLFIKDKPSDQDKMTFAGVLVKIGDHEFLDLVSKDWDMETESIPLQVKSDKDGTSIQPQLTKVGASAYLEFGAATAEEGGKIQATLRPSHWLIKINKRENKLRLQWADDDDFRKAVLAGTLHLSSVTLGEGKDQRIVITAGTMELQKFFSEHADDKAFFSGGIDGWLRKKQ